MHNLAIDTITLAIGQVRMFKEGLEMMTAPDGRRWKVFRRRLAWRPPGRPGGYRNWDNTARLWWGDLYPFCPDELLTELNGAAGYSRITPLLRRCRTQKR